MGLRKFSFHSRALIAALLLAIQPFALPAQSPPELPDPGKTSLSRDQQIQLGLQASGEVYKQMPVLKESSAVTQYIQSLGKKLQEVIPPDRSWPYRFQVVEQKEINAFAIPGGPIFINVGTIQAADTEAELVGVMAHEMSHVYMQHSAKQMAKAQWTGLLAGIAGAIIPQSGLGGLARMGIQFGAGTVMMKYSRGDEAQADAVGAIIMYKAGYDPQAMADFFTKLEKKYGSGGPQFLSDHPNPGNRQASIQKEIRDWPRKNYLASSEAFTRARKEAEGIKAYSGEEIAQGAKQGQWAQQNRQNGSIPADLPASAPSEAGAEMASVSYSQVRPSANYRQANLEGFTISYPDNWKTGGSASSFVVAPPSAVSQSAVAYGAIITAAPTASSDSLDQATKQVVNAIQSENQGVRVSGGASRITANGLEGRSLYLSGSSPIQENGRALPERDWVVVLPRAQGGVTYLVFIAPERDFSQLEPTYRKMLESLRLR
ncbi:MAG TPA: M48 family metallopeptidase [Candidatus Angelobacter sp.]|nr:M48 family metallopeptidase [Candidatus Angelobacter sp.]